MSVRYHLAVLLCDLPDPIYSVALANTVSSFMPPPWPLLAFVLILVCWPWCQGEQVIVKAMSCKFVYCTSAVPG